MKNNMLSSFCVGAVRAVVTLLVVLLVGCDSGQDTANELTKVQQQQLETKVAQRWQARIAGDWDKAWEFTSPAYREVFPKQLYARKFSYAVQWELTGVELLNYDASAAVASVVVRVMSKPTKQTSAASVAVGAIPRELREKWIFESGEWWFSTSY